MAYRILFSCHAESVEDEEKLIFLPPLRHISYGQCFGSGSGFRGRLDPDSESGFRGLKEGQKC